MFIKKYIKRSQDWFDLLYLAWAFSSVYFIKSLKYYGVCYNPGLP